MKYSIDNLWSKETIMMRRTGRSRWPVGFQSAKRDENVELVCLFIAQLRACLLNKRVKVVFPFAILRLTAMRSTRFSILTILSMFLGSRPGHTDDPVVSAKSLRKSSSSLLR